MNKKFIDIPNLRELLKTTDKVNKKPEENHDRTVNYEQAKMRGFDEVDLIRH